MLSIICGNTLCAGRYYGLFILLLVSKLLSAQVVFSYTGTQQTYVVPAGVTSLVIDMAGGEGGQEQNFTEPDVDEPGWGGRVQASIEVTPGETIYIYVGGVGGEAGPSSSPAGGVGGWNGGGDGSFANPGTSSYRAAGGGGGASDIRIGGTSLADRKIVAAGGGGSGDGHTLDDDGGDGGGGSGSDGLSGYSADAAGKGGTQAIGGAGGDYFGSVAENGSLGQGGAGNDYGAGGGGGYYGGGGGVFGAGGGGGSSYSDAVLTSSVTMTSGYNQGDGYVIITASATLPISLVSFDALIIKDQVRISWKTATERNNDYFSIERSQNGKEWEEISTVSGAGNSKVIQNYSMHDIDPLSGTSYYRLKQTDYSGSFNYSDIVTVTYFADAKADNVVIYPNPVTNDLLTIRAVSSEMEGLIILNSLGHNISHLVSIDRSSDYEAIIDLSRLKAGSYLVKTSKKAFKIYKY